MIRPRRTEDLEPCLRLLHAVHLRDPAITTRSRSTSARGWKRVGTASLLLDDGHSVLPVLLFALPDSLE